MNLRLLTTVPVVNSLRFAGRRPPAARGARMAGMVEIRPTTAEGFPEFAAAVFLAFGNAITPPQVEHFRGIVEYDRTLAAHEEGRVVGTAASFGWELTVPGGTVAAGAVSAVGVRATHRRRGVLRSMMTAQLDDIAGRGEPVAVLLASESSIYGRFGYGAASCSVSWSVATDRSAFATPPAAPGRIVLTDAAGARPRLPAVEERARHRHPGRLGRTAAVWDLELADHEYDRDGASALFVAVHEDADGEADGYVAYRVRDGHTQGLADKTLLVVGHAAVDDEVAAALWRFCFDVDLVRTVTCADAPVDDPLRWRLMEPRQLRVTHLIDGLWVRILDVPAYLSARRHPVEGRLVVDVRDDDRPGCAGRWELEGGPDGATCRRTTAEPDLALGIAELGAVSLGGVRPSTLAGAGRVTELRAGALGFADAFLSWSPAAWCGVDF